MQCVLWNYVVSAVISVVINDIMSHGISQVIIKGITNAWRRGELPSPLCNIYMNPILSLLLLMLQWEQYIWPPKVQHLPYFCSSWSGNSKSDPCTVQRFPYCWSGWKGTSEFTPPRLFCIWASRVGLRYIFVLILKENNVIFSISCSNIFVFVFMFLLYICLHFFTIQCVYS